MKIKMITSSLNRLTTCEHSTFPLLTDSGTWSCFYLNAKCVITEFALKDDTEEEVYFLSQAKTKRSAADYWSPLLQVNGVSPWKVTLPHLQSDRCAGDPVGHQHTYNTNSNIRSWTHTSCNGKHDFQMFSEPYRRQRMPTGPLRLLKNPSCHYECWRARRLPRK